MNPRIGPLADAGPGRPGIGRGEAFGAVTILNATATGVGCALAIDAMTHATWEWMESGAGPDPTEGDADPLVASLADIQARALQRHYPPARAAASSPASPHGFQADQERAWKTPYRAQVEAAFPPARGLKTSSAVAGALARASRAAAGLPPDDMACAHVACDAGLRAGASLTGAFDDQVAVLWGGCHVVDNRARAVLRTLQPEPWDVAVWVPAHGIAKSRVAGVDATPVADAVRAACAQALRGDLPGALTANGAAFLRLYRAAGLPVTAAPVDAALGAGALGAGLSGTGPAVAALFAPGTADDAGNAVRAGSEPKLPAVAGGTWRWARVVASTGLAGTPEVA